MLGGSEGLCTELQSIDGDCFFLAIIKRDRPLRWSTLGVGIHVDNRDARKASHVSLSSLSQQPADRRLVLISYLNLAGNCC